MKHESARALEACPLSPSSGEDIWRVKTPSGIHTWTLDELDLAFQRGQIDAATPVFTSGMTEWQTLGVVAELDAPAASDTAASDTAASDTAASDTDTANTPEPSGLLDLSPIPPRHLPAPTKSAATPPPRRLPPPLADGRSFPPWTAVVGAGGPRWSTIAPPGPDPETGVRRNAAVVPFAVRRRFGSALDHGSNLLARLRATHPRWAAVGPWLFGAALSGVLVLGVYRLASAPTQPGAQTPSGATVSGASASPIMPGSPSRAPQPAVASAAAPSARSASLSNGGAERPMPAGSAAAAEPHATTRASRSGNDATAASSADGAVLRAKDLKSASSRSERGATASRRAKAKAKAWSKRSKARAARRARRSPRARASAD